MPTHPPNPPLPSDFDVTRFAGTWRIAASSFPMWTRGKRTEPRFRYSPLPPSRRGALRLADEVSYVTGGRTRTINGVDTRLDRPGVVFGWRGSGLLRPLSSVWHVTEWDPAYEWAVITFSRSLVTPAGVDVVVRDQGRDAHDRGRDSHDPARDRTVSDLAARFGADLLAPPPSTPSAPA